MNEHQFIILLLVSIGALLMPSASKRLMLPSSVGEILFGIILVSLLPDMYHEPDRVVRYFSSFGFLLLMYMAGLELDFDKLKEIPKRDLTMYFIMYAVVALGCIIVAKLLNLSFAFSLIFFTTGLGLLFPVLKDAGLTKTGVGQNLLIIAMIGEILTLAGLTIFTLASEYGMTLASVAHFSLILVFIFGTYIFIKLLKVILWWFPNRQSALVLVGNPTETGIRGNFVILFASVVFAELMGIEQVVGAFIGGTIVALVIADREAVLEKISGVSYGFFVPIFFISVGMQVTISDMLQGNVMLLSLLITFVLLVVKLFGGIVLLFTSLSKRSSLLVATGLTFPLTILVVVGAIFYEMELITKQESSAVLLSAIFSSILYPWIFKFATNVMFPDVTAEEK